MLSHILIYKVTYQQQEDKIDVETSVVEYGMYAGTYGQETESLMRYLLNEICVLTSNPIEFLFFVTRVVP